MILKLAEETVYCMVQLAELPAFKVRGQWRVRPAVPDTAVRLPDSISLEWLR